jgi:hypothetical protein
MGVEVGCIRRESFRTVASKFRKSGKSNKWGVFPKKCIGKLPSNYS